MTANVEMQDLTPQGREYIDALRHDQLALYIVIFIYVDAAPGAQERVLPRAGASDAHPHPRAARRRANAPSRICQSALVLGQPVVSQHLAALRARNVVTVRREGTQAYYALRSPLVADLLRVAREFLNQRLSESHRCCAS